MSDNENRVEDEKKALEVKDWVIIGIAAVALIFVVGFFKGSASNFKIKNENERLKNDIQYLSVLAATLMEMKQQEIDLNMQECSEKLNRGYLDLYEKLNVESESTAYFRAQLQEAAIEKKGMIEQRNSKAKSYNDYSKSFNWENYQADLYNFPREIQMME